jgi:hypothetical protein
MSWEEFIGSLTHSSSFSIFLLLFIIIKVYKFLFINYSNKKQKKMNFSHDDYSIITLVVRRQFHNPN